MTCYVKSPLRDEILVIRQLFGYADARQHEASHLGATLPNSSMKDVLLIGIDVDTYQGYERLPTNPQLHIGVSVLDTRVLHQLVHEGLDSVRETDVVESYQFVVGDSKYCKTASRKFMFGESQSVPLGEVKARVESLACRLGRDSILAFHGDHSDRKALANLDIQLQPLYIIDNVKAAQYPLDLSYRLGLEAMLDTFGIPYTNLHAAGNDAHYALRSLLMIAAIDGQKMKSEPTREDLFSTLSAIARSARPITAGEKAKAFEESRRQIKAEKAARHKTRRAARTERRRQEREACVEIDGQCSRTEDVEDVYR
ncbi:hypothetical protein F5B22DRAFT_582857 [Xylaria bambusicola]|uniref:uncharacterized protein n=1 Tax=Xylaria bambusicola TaxID=326684 RepID=UPI0020087989|nr:uncharacterized protein F5B22DRAFT_582857 [Xylaria bambusicola]KAI0527923.1 hypothetical protein F5B22DRAFT_582857 [Xylaria bambusicola]